MHTVNPVMSDFFLMLQSGVIFQCDFKSISGSIYSFDTNINDIVEHFWDTYVKYVLTCDLWILCAKRSELKNFMR